MAADVKVRFLRDAEKHVLQRKYQQAISEYIKVVKNDPNDMLTTNTIGDLYLRLGKVADANRYFVQVAENYSQNNFFLKAIAVYKKILNSDPGNIEINLTIASLYAKQGLSVDARIQYLRVAQLFANAGRNRESLEAYEKVGELDPANAAVQLKLAQAYLSDNATEKAHACFTAAARAQAKADQLEAAAQSFMRAMLLKPLDVDVMRGFLDCSLKLGDVGLVLEQLKNSVTAAPDNVDLRQMLGRGYLAANDLENAAITFEVLLSLNQDKCLNFFDLSAAFLKEREYGRAVTCLDPAIPVIISRRETGKAVEAYNHVLAADPSNILALTRLASIYSAVNDHSHYLETVDSIIDCYVTEQSPREALEWLERAIQAAPGNPKYVQLHREAFDAAFPDAPYQPPAAVSEVSEVVGQPDRPEQGSSTVEIDLLMNYGLKEKALSMLLEMVDRNPLDKEVRKRLLSLHTEERAHSKAAEQCLLLAALSQQENDKKGEQEYLSEAIRLDPTIDIHQGELAEYARSRGLNVVSPMGEMDSGSGSAFDFTEDISDIFFKATEQGGEKPEMVLEPEITPEEYTPKEDIGTSSDDMEGQLQEVDFYLRLGFQEEARAKLDELARSYGRRPELAARLRELEPVANNGQDAPPEAGQFATIGCGPGDLSEEFPDLSPNFNAPAATASDVTSGMFSDLLDDVNLTGTQMRQEDFETHFCLGLAFREIELVDEAIREFQNALKTLESTHDPREVIRCCGMLSTCYLEKKMPQSVIQWCETGISVPEITRDEEVALQYDMGVARSLAGDPNGALDCFQSIYGAEPGYRDVAKRIDELRSGPDRNGS